MKSSNLAKLGVLFLSLGALVGCGGGGAKSSSSKACTHKWTDVKVIEEATCAKEGSKEQKCDKCGETRTTKINKTSHDWETKSETAAECGVEGSRVSECKNCHETKTETLPALEHEYGETQWATQPTCTEGGAGTKTCLLCGHEEAVTSDPLGHNIVCDDDGEAPEAGKAKVRMYHCENGCNQTYFGFKANEVTADSLGHLVVGTDGGARFWGRPIGNDVALSDQGDPDENSHEPVFNENQQGDFFEYKFDLTAEQVATIGSAAKLYCDAKPANYLGANGIDFWANKEGDTDWTRGMYIDGDNKGQEITDYRYVLYVDGQRKNFDADVKVPVPNGDPRGEYVLPYTFALHAGTNTIRLVMAGGYRSTFYNFTFRAA